jgi:4-amino-4-deoxy-L-arabinose transferase-like glycosyltransferase
MAAQAPPHPSPTDHAGARRPRWWPALGIAAVAGAYLATRVLFATRFPYFFDEGTYAGFAEQGSESPSELFVSLTIAREPLQIWLAILPLKLGFDPLTAGRIVSVAAGLVTVAVVGLLGRRLGGAAVGWAAAGLAVLLPFFVVHDGIGIYEPLVTLIMGAALLVQIDLARRPRVATGLLLGVVLAAGVLTKRNTLPALALLPASLLLLDWSPPGRRERLRTFAAAVAVAAVPVVVAMLVLRSSAHWPRYEELSRPGAGGVGFAGVRPLGDVLRDPFAFTAQAWSAYRPALLSYVTVPLLVATAAGGALAWRTRPRLTAVLVLWIAVPFAVALTFGTLSFPRHVMYLLPPMLVLMAYALVRGARAAFGAWPRRTALAACAAGAAVALGPALAFDARVLAHPDRARYPGPDDLQYVRGTQAGGPWPAVANEIERRAIGPRVDVVLHRSYADVLRFLLHPEGRFRLIDTRRPEAWKAQLLVRDESAFVFPDDPGPGLTAVHFREVARFPRPRGGAVVRLYENRATR